MSAPSRLLDRLPAGFADAVALFLTMRVALGLVALYLWWRGGLPGPCHFEVARNGWLTIPPLADEGSAFPLVGVWQRWDACWYSKIAAFGYEPAEISINFWPMFPMLTRGIAPWVGGSVALGGLIVSGIAYIGAMIGLYRLVGARHRSRGRPSDDAVHHDLPERVLPVRAIHRGAVPGPGGLDDRRRPGAPLGLGGHPRRDDGADPDPGRLPRPADRLGGARRVGPRRLATVARLRRCPTWTAGSLVRGAVAALGPVLGFLGYLAFGTVARGA